MADKHWHGAAQDGAYGNTQNWLEGIIPAANDDVFVDGDEDITGGLDQSAVTIDSFNVQPSYTGKIASAAEELKLTFATTSTLAWRSGAIGWIHLNNTKPVVTVRSKLVGEGLHLTGGTAGNSVTLVIIRRGELILEKGDYDLILMESDGNVRSDAHLTNLNAKVLLLRQVGGVYGQDDKDTSSAPNVVAHKMHAGTATITEGDYQDLEQFGGLVLYHVDKADGTLDNAEIFGGEFNASGDVRPKIITNLDYHGEAIVNVDNGAGNITLTNGVGQRGSKPPIIGYDVTLTPTPF